MAMPESFDLGEGIVLERARTGHADALARAVRESLDHLKPYMPWADTLNAQADTQRHRLGGVERLWDRAEELQFVIRESESGVVVGAAGIIRTDRWRLGGDNAEIGYWTHADWCHRGLATRAARTLADASFAVPGIERVVIVCDATNEASIAVPRKLGFRLHQTFERPPEAPAESGRMQVWVRTRDDQACASPN